MLATICLSKSSKILITLYQFLFRQIRFLWISPKFGAQPRGRGDISGQTQLVSCNFSSENVSRIHVWMKPQRAFNLGQHSQHWNMHYSATTFGQQQHVCTLSSLKSGRKGGLIVLKRCVINVINTLWPTNSPISYAVLKKPHFCRSRITRITVRKVWRDKPRSSSSPNA